MAPLHSSLPTLCRVIVFRLLIKDFIFVMNFLTGCQVIVNFRTALSCIFVSLYIVNNGWLELCVWSCKFVSTWLVSQWIGWAVWPRKVYIYIHLIYYILKYCSHQYCVLCLNFNRMCRIHVHVTDDEISNFFLACISKNDVTLAYCLVFFTWLYELCDSCVVCMQSLCSPCAVSV